MAANFKIVTNNVGKDNIIVNLIGDFDGTSAWELINRLETISDKKAKVEVNTSGLKSLIPFGLDVLRMNAGSLGFSASSFFVSGSKAHMFSGLRPFSVS